jgi:cation-transporting P-type ATPase D
VFYVVKQISTQQEDYLIDTIALHDSMEILRPVFANPSICKVCKLSIALSFFPGQG